MPSDLFTTEIHGTDGSRILNGLYDWDKLNTKDKYSFFLGGINSHISIYPSKGYRPKKLLLIADSFGQSLAPFLAYSYRSIEIIDTRFFNDNIYDFIKEHNINNILVMVSMENLSTQDNLRKLTNR